MINGESRPLDVPPMIYQGNVLVPVRVISEGMGAYVQWVPDQHVVVVRYLPATPPPAPAPTHGCRPPPPTPAPTPKPEYKDLFVAGDYVISPHVYNAFANSRNGGTGGTFSVRGAGEFNLFNIPWMIEGDYNNWQYPHACGVAQSVATPQNAPQCFVTAIGGRFATYVPAFTAANRDVDVRLGLRIFNPRVYIGVGYIWGSNNYGYPEHECRRLRPRKVAGPRSGAVVQRQRLVLPELHGHVHAITRSLPAVPTSDGVGYNMLKYKVGLN